MGNTHATPRARADALIADALRSPVAIFSKRSCGYCTAAKRLVAAEAGALRTRGCTLPPPRVVELDDGSLPPDVAAEVQAALRARTGAATVPRVFVDGELVGGAAETVRYAQSGALRLALIKAGQCRVDQ